MIIQLNDIMKADIIQLEDYDMQLAFEIETVERQLQYADKKNDRVWHEKALKARDHMKRTRALIKTRLDKLYFGEERMIHGAILAQIRKEMPIGKFMSYVHRAKQEAGVMIPLLWILSAYAFARVFEADTLYQMICYGAMFCLSGAALAFMDDVISD